MAFQRCSRSLVLAFLILASSMLDIASANAAPCDGETSPLANWQQDFDNFLSASQGPPRTFCFKTGTYVGRMVVDGRSNVVLRAADGAQVTFRLEQGLQATEAVFTIKNSSSITLQDLAVQLSQAPAGTQLVTALRVDSSQDVTLERVAVSNQSFYPNTVGHKVDRALVVNASQNVTVRSSAIAGLGKQVFVAEYGAQVRVEDSTVRCYYFCLEADVGSRIVAVSSELRVHHEQEPSDDHAAVWVDKSDIVLINDTFTFVTGAGLLAGSNTGHRVDVVDGHVVNPARMRAWIGTHANYADLVLYVKGPLATTIPPYFCIAWHNATCRTGSERGNATPGTRVHVWREQAGAFESIPLPAVIDSLVLVNTDFTGGAFVAQNTHTNATTLETLLLMDWSTLQASDHAGWLDINDRIVAGDFLRHGRRQLFSFNNDSAHIGGAIRLLELDYLGDANDTPYWRAERWWWWTDVGPSAHAGWMDSNDRILAGDFLGTGRDQLLFFNTDPNGIGGAIRIQQYDFGSANFVNVYWQDWSAVTPGAHAGWLDPNDRIVAGDFMNTGRAQLLFFNTDPNRVGGAIRIQQYDHASGGFVNVFWQDWSTIGPNAHAGWLDPSDRIVAGNFLGNGRTQLLFFNNDPNHVGGAVRVQELDLVNGGFVNKYWQDWSSTPSNSYGGWLDASDMSFSVGPL